MYVNFLWLCGTVAVNTPSTTGPAGQLAVANHATWGLAKSGVFAGSAWPCLEGTRPITEDIHGRPE